MSTPDREVVEETSEISLLVEGDRLTRIDSSDLVQIEDLHVVADGLGADDGIVVEHTDFAPG